MHCKVQTMLWSIIWQTGQHKQPTLWYWCTQIPTTTSTKL